MEEDYGANIISITDEDGVEYELEVLSSVEYQGAEYLALTPADADDDAEELEVSILKSVMDGGDPLLETVEDDKRRVIAARRIRPGEDEQELETVYDLLMQSMFDDEDFDDEE